MLRKKVLFALLLRGSMGWAQTRPGDESRAEFAGRDPVAAVIESVNGHPSILQRNGTHPSGARTWRIPVNVPAATPVVTPAVERCFLVHATASGIINVNLSATVGTREALASTPINATMANGVAIQRVCGIIDRRSRLQLSIRATAGTRWALSVIDAPVETMTFDPRLEQSALQARERLAAALANGGSTGAATTSADAGVAVARIPLGGTETDYIATQIRSEYSGTPSAFATIPVSRTVLSTAEEHSVRSRLSAGRCYEAIAVGTPSVTDINVRWIDSTNSPVAQDTGHRNKERVRFCAQFSATFTVTARVFAGFGPIGLQLIDVGTP